MKITRWLGVTLLSVLFTKTGSSQQLRLGSNPSAVEKTAVLELQSNNQGLLFSRISDTALINVMNPPDGMVIYFTPLKQLLLRANGYWQPLTPAAALNNYWNVEGNNNGVVKKIGTIDNNALPFITNNTERMRITNTGRLGIGNTAPTEVLDVTGNVTFSGALMPGGSAGTSGQFLRSNGAGSAPAWTTLDTGNMSNFYQKVRGLISAGSGITYNAATGVISATTATNQWNYGGNTVTAEKTIGTIDNFALPFLTNNTERMRITNAGRVGIGTNAPNNILEVTGTNTSTGVSGLRLTNLGTATVATANTKLLSVNSNGDVIVTNNPAANNWLFTGNAGVNPAVNFLGTTDDKQMILKSNNQSYLEFGRRQTLGLTQGYTDYTDNDEKVTYVRSALQFEANAAEFYKPKMWTDANGNFRMKGSSAGTDYFEFGSTGASNSGGFEFVIGDDGDEPIVFKSYNYTSGMSEMMRLQSGRVSIGSNAFDAVAPEKFLLDAGTTTSYNLMTARGSIDNYLQFNLKNGSAGGNASSDIVATANNGTETTNFIDMGINSSGFGNNVYPILNGANNAYLYSTGNDFIMGNGTAGKNLRFFTGGFTNANERMRIDGAGKVGIGNTAPTEVLDVTGNLKLSGAFMPGGNAGTAGYVLTSNGAGSAPTWTAAASSGWNLDGNSLSAVKKLGTISNHDLPFITNNTEKMRLSSTGNLAIGTSHFDASAPEKLLIDAGVTESYNLIKAVGSVNNYLQFNIQNESAGLNASADIVATNNTGTETARYINMGINSSGFTNTGILGGPNNAYLYSTGSDLVIGNATAGEPLRLFTGGTATTNERMRIDGNGNVGIGTTNPSFPLSVERLAGTVASFNRTLLDGTLISLRQDGIEEGTISVLFNTVSYNAFTGSHYARTSQPIEKGMLVTLTGENEYFHKNKNSEIIYGVRPSAQANDPKIMGAFLGLQEASLPYSDSNPNLVMAVGNGVMWVADKGENLAAGDYLVSSDITGHAMKENGTYSTAFVIARVAEAVNWAEETAVIDGVKHKLVSVFFESFVKNNAQKELDALKQEMKDLKERMLKLEQSATQR